MKIPYQKSKSSLPNIYIIIICIIEHFSKEFIILIAPMIPLHLSNSFQYIQTNLQSNIFAASCTVFFMPKKLPLGSIFRAWEGLNVKNLQINIEKLALVQKISKLVELQGVH